MATTVSIDHSVTIMSGRLCVFESDVRVKASVCRDDEVIIQSVEMVGRVPRHSPHSVFLMDTVHEPMTDSDNSHMVRLGMWVEETLLADDEFVCLAQQAAEEINAGSIPFRERMKRELEKEA